MFGLQPTHLLIIVAVALFFFGPTRLPELARSLGKAMREFQSAVKETPAVAVEEPKRVLPPSTEKTEPTTDIPSNTLSDQAKI